MSLDSKKKFNPNPAVAWEAEKKNSFLVALPIRPLAPSPLSA